MDSPVKQNDDARTLLSPTLIRLGLVLLFLAAIRPAPSLIKPSPQTTDSDKVFSSSALTPADQLIHLLADADANGWTDVQRREYAELRRKMGDDKALVAWLATQNTVSEADLPLLRDLVAQEVAQLDWEAARSHLQNILMVAPDDATATYQLGLLLASEDTSQAIRYLSQPFSDERLIANARRVNSTLLNTGAWTADSYYQIGLALVEIGEWPFAEKAFDAGLVLDSQNWRLYAYRGYVRDQQGRNGRIDYSTAIGLSPTAALPFYFLGLHWRGIEPDLAASREALLRAYAFDSENPAIAAELGTAFQLLGDNAEAKEWFNLAVELAPDDVEWQRRRATFFVEANFLLSSEGIATIEESYRRFPSDPDIVITIGYASFLLQRIRDAEAFLEMALDMEPTNARAQYYYGLLQQRLGNTSAAMLAYQTAVDTGGSDTGYGYLASRALLQLNLLP